MLKVIDVDELKPGMFVNEVVEQTGQMKIKTRGLVKNGNAISSLKKKGVVKLQVDLDRSELAVDEPAPSQPAEVKPTMGKSIGEQLSSAQTLYDKAKDTQREFISEIQARRTGNLDTLQDASLDIMDSVMDAPGAMSCLTHINKSGEYLLEHSLNCSVLMTMFAKHLDFDSETIEQLAFAGMLMDVGMANVPVDIRRKAKKLTKPEMDVVITHVDIGVDIVERCGEVSDLVREIIYSHHERADGSGYPDGRQGDDINQFVMMAAIVDSYDAMTTERPFQKARSSAAALKTLMLDNRYDNELVQKFIQCIGAHPVGSLVKLTSGRLGLVVRANRKNPLQPRVATFYNVNTGHYTETKIVDLQQVDVEIESSVRPKEFGINLGQFFKDVLIGQLA